MLLNTYEYSYHIKTEKRKREITARRRDAEFPPVGTISDIHHVVVKEPARIIYPLARGTPRTRHTSKVLIVPRPRSRRRGEPGTSAPTICKELPAAPKFAGAEPPRCGSDRPKTPDRRGVEPHSKVPGIRPARLCGIPLARGNHPAHLKRCPHSNRNGILPARGTQHHLLHHVSHPGRLSAGGGTCYRFHAAAQKFACSLAVRVVPNSYTDKIIARHRADLPAGNSPAPERMNDTSSEFWWPSRWRGIPAVP